MTLTWDTVYRQDRHQLTYPSEHVVRFLASLPPNKKLAVDIGAGYGRHSRLLRKMGYTAVAIDSSAEAVRATKAYRTCDMTELPFGNDTFDVAIAYSVYHYGTHSDHVQAVNELHRVLKPEGHALIAIRTNKDWRAAGIPPGEPEHGMPMTFLYQSNIPTIYHAFQEVNVELAEFTTHNQTRLNSDWLITLTK